MKHKRLYRGFSLMELMIVVMVVGILSALAYPSYREHMRKSRRTQAITTLLSAQQWMERFYTENFRYDENLAREPVRPHFRLVFRQAPAEGIPVYDVDLEPLEADLAKTTYSIKARRKENSVMADDRCGDFSIDHLGRKNLENHSGFADKPTAIAFCWQ